MNVSNDVMKKILYGVTSPEVPFVLKYNQVVESYVELTEVEKANLDENYRIGDINRRLLTIYKPEDINTQYKANFEILKRQAARFEKDYGHRCLFTSVFRSREHHIKIYNKINAARVLAGLNPLNIPWSSLHLSAQAFDVVPKNKPISHLHDFLTEEYLQSINAWQEHPQHTRTWAHLQFMPYPSWTPDKSRKYHI